MDTEKMRQILIKERKIRKITQEKLSEQLNISRGAYAKYETGDNIPPLDTIVKIADIYNLPLDYLVGREIKQKKARV